MTADKFSTDVSDYINAKLIPHFQNQYHRFKSTIPVQDEALPPCRTLFPQWLEGYIYIQPLHPTVYGSESITEGRNVKVSLNFKAVLQSIFDLKTGLLLLHPTYLLLCRGQ